MAGAGAPGRVGLALEPDDGLAAWAAAEGLDALVLHRHWGFAPPPGLAVLGVHDPFDHRLALAGNPWLHGRLGLSDPRPLHPKAALAGAPGDLRDRVRALFGGEEGFRPGAGAAVQQAVLADALRPELGHAAAAAGAQLYVTGTWRPSAHEAVRETGIAVQLVGHRRQEEWSLGLLAELLRERLPGTRVLVRSGDPRPPVSASA